VGDETLPAGTSLGAALRAAREAAGLSVEEVSARTRIRSTVIRDLESDRIESSGGAVYARGHVKSICGSVGVAPAPYLDLFSRQVGTEPVLTLQPSLPEPRHATTEALHVPTAAAPERRGPNWAAAGAAALAVLVGLFVVGQVTKPDTSATLTTSTQTPSAVASPAPVKVQAPGRNLTAARPLPTGAVLRVRLIGGSSWVSVRNSTRTLFEGVLPAGAVKDFRDPKQLRLIVGNAGAVNLVCSGRDLGPAGGQGAVRRFTCNAAGIVAG
jgi:transcriptional regulator with XRE-family HTH domain